MDEPLVFPFVYKVVFWLVPTFGYFCGSFFGEGAGVRGTEGLGDPSFGSSFRTWLS